MATNPQAEGQTRINFQISNDEKAALQKLADASGMKLSAYIRKVLIEEGIQEHTIYETKKTKPGLYIIPEPDLEQDIAAEPPQAPYRTHRPDTPKPTP